MKRVSILNHVIGPVMRGPSSSHTAGPWRIARMAADLLGAPPEIARFSFDPSSSLAVCYHDQGSDLAFATGLLGRELTDTEFHRMLSLAPQLGLDLSFEKALIPEADHPNSSLLYLRGADRELVMHSKSTGGGSFEITSLNGFPVRITGDSYVLFCPCDEGKGAKVAALLKDKGWDASVLKSPEGSAIFASSPSVAPSVMDEVAQVLEGRPIFTAAPVMPPMSGEPLFTNLQELLAMAEEQGWSLGRAALKSEAALLGLSEEEVSEEMNRRLQIMFDAVDKGLAGDFPSMKLLSPMAGTLQSSLEEGKMFLGGPHAKGAIRAMAALHVCSAGGVVVAAPTGGAAGVIPGVAATLARDFNIDEDRLLLALWAAGAVGFLHDTESTFAAEVAGCQVEIGAAGAMAAAAVVEAAGGTAKQACDAAATVFQNVMGSVCDLIQGVVEIPCHSRNAALASQAFLVADMVLGGYQNPVPLDETIDAVDRVGRMMPVELRCTSRGGLATCPTACALPRLDIEKANE